MPDIAQKRSTAADPARLEHMQELISRYPRVTESENAEILRYLKKGPALDAALLTTVEPIRPQLERFRQDHRRHFTVGAKEYLFVAVLVAALVALCVMLWDVGIK